MILGIIILIVGMVFVGVTLVKASGKRNAQPGVPLYPEQNGQWHGAAPGAPAQQSQWPQRPYGR